MLCFLCQAPHGGGDARAWLEHVNACGGGGPAPAASRAPPALAARFAHLFVPRLHASADVAAIEAPPPPPPPRGAAVSAAAWPMPPLALAAATPAARAIVVRGGAAYALAASDASVVRELAGGRRVLLGSEAPARSAEFLRACGVTAVVNCAFNSPPLPASDREAAGVAFFEQLHFVDAAVVEGQNHEALIEAGADAVAAALARGGGEAGAGHVLVHCVAGVSRSASVVIAWLVKHEGLTLLEAASAVKAARPVAHPNLCVRVRSRARSRARARKLHSILCSLPAPLDPPNPLRAPRNFFAAAFGRRWARWSSACAG